MSGGAVLDIFNLRDSVVQEYERFATSFTTIHAEDIDEQVKRIYDEKRYWPEPLIQINPNYRRVTTIKALVEQQVLDPICAEIFQFNGVPLELYEHQKQARRTAVRRGKTGSLGRQKHDAHEEVLRCERIATASNDLVEQLRGAHARAIALLECPTCGRTADPARDFQPRDRGSFRCECRGCGTTWGTRLCGDGHRYATMLPSGDFVDATQQGPGWEDRVYGCDILALPARRSDGQWGFVCPECGRVG